MANKSQNLISLKNIQAAPLKQFASVLIDNKLLKPGVKIADVDKKIPEFKDFLASSLSDKDDELASSLHTRHFLKKFKKSDVKAFAIGTLELAKKIKTHAVQNPDDNSSKVKSDAFCGMLENVGCIVKLDSVETPSSLPKDIGNEDERTESTLTEDNGAEINKLKTRISDLNDEVATILKNNAKNVAGVRSKSILSKASRDLQEESPNVNDIKIDLDQVDTLLEGNEEDDGEPLMNIADLKTLLIKSSKGKSFPFACCDAPDGFHYTMHKRKKSPNLAKNLKRDTKCSPAKLTFGHATVDKKDKVVELDISEKSDKFPKIFKLMKLWLKSNKPLPAKRLRIKQGDEVILPDNSDIRELLEDYKKRVEKAIFDSGDGCALNIMFSCSLYFLSLCS